MTRYKNRWWPKLGASEYYETNDKGTECHGYMIYLRKDEQTGIDIYDIVKDGFCVSKMAGIGGAFREIDRLLDNQL